MDGDWDHIGQWVYDLRCETCGCVIILADEGEPDGN